MKSALCLSYERSDVEWTFSTSTNILTEDKAEMSEKISDMKIKFVMYPNNVNILV